MTGLRIVVTGLTAQHPRLGGMAWHDLQYVLGLARLGHDVYYLEDSGQWPYTYSAAADGSDWIAWDPALNVSHLAAVMDRFGLGERWMYRFPIKPRWYGLPARKRREVLSTADLLINVSGALRRPGDYRAIPRLAYVDSDPVFTQIQLNLARGQIKFQRRVAAHDVNFSYGERLGDGVPGTQFRWRPTRQPIVLSEWAPIDKRREAYTTIMSWTSYRPLRFRGALYGQKDVEFSRYATLAGQVSGVRLEVALGSLRHREWQSSPWPEEPTGLLRRLGWKLVDAQRTCGGLDSYRNYIRSSKAEWSVAKNGYVVGQAGWFSCRSACYLAAGRPVIVQDTGFSPGVPTGEGIVTFSSVPEAAAGIAQVEADYNHHSKAARAIAHEYFDSSKVLGRLVEEAMRSHG
jgi:hypothetical protein